MKGDRRNIKEWLGAEKGARREREGSEIPQQNV
jgi:hypothetical protein